MSTTDPILYGTKDITHHGKTLRKPKIAVANDCLSQADCKLAF